MKIDDFVNHIHPELYKLSQKFPTINQGGCGIFSLLLYNKLLSINIKPEFIFLGFKQTDKISHSDLCNCKTVSEFSKHFYFFHIVLLVDNTYIDSTGVYKNIKDLRKAHKLPFISQLMVDKEILEQLSKDTDWHVDYDISNTPIIEQELDEIFSNYLYN